MVEGNPCLKYIQLIVLPWSGSLTVRFKKDGDAAKCAPYTAPSARQKRNMQ